MHAEQPLLPQLDSRRGAARPPRRRRRRRRGGVAVVAFQEVGGSAAALPANRIEVVVPVLLRPFVAPLSSFLVALRRAPLRSFAEERKPPAAAAAAAAPS